MIITFFDTETTGLLKPSPAGIDEQPYIIEICCMRLNWGEEVIHEQTFNTFIRPPVPISKRITEITGIDEAMLHGAPTFAEIAGDLFRFWVGTEMMVAHNLAFDRGMLGNELIRMDALLHFPWPPMHLCTVEASMPIEQRRLSLGRLYELATGKDHSKAHRAEADVKALVHAFNYLVDKEVVKI